MIRNVAKPILASLIGAAVATVIVACRGGGGDSVSGSGSGGSATLSWNAPATEADGSTPLAQVDGYRVYYGQESRHYTSVIDVGNVTTHTVSNLAPGTYYFAVTARNSGGESDFSVEGNKTIR